MNKIAAISLDIEKGDILLGGRFKNSPTEVKEFGRDKLGQYTVNGKKLLAFRIKKLMPKQITKESSMEQWLKDIKQAAFKDEMQKIAAGASASARPVIKMPTAKIKGKTTFNPSQHGVLKILGKK